MNLSPHFTLDEMTRSDRAARLGIANNPTPAQVDAGRLLCERVLEPIREALGVVHVHSGFRSDALNEQTPGSSSTSQHVWGPRGAAADIHVDCMGVADLVEWIAKNVPEFDQCIHERKLDRGYVVSEWCHVSFRDPSVVRNRRTVLHIDT